MVMKLIYSLQDSWEWYSYSIKGKRPDRDHQTIVLDGNKYNTEEGQIETNFPNWMKPKVKVFRLDTYFSTEYDFLLLLRRC